MLHGVGARSIGNISRNLCRMTVYYVRQQRNSWLNSSNIHVSSENWRRWVTIYSVPTGFLRPVFRRWRTAVLKLDPRISRTLGKMRRTHNYFSYCVIHAWPSFLFCATLVQFLTSQPMSFCLLFGIALKLPVRANLVPYSCATCQKQQCETAAQVQASPLVELVVIPFSTTELYFCGRFTDVVKVVRKRPTSRSSHAQAVVRFTRTRSFHCKLCTYFTCDVPSPHNWAVVIW